MKKIYTLSIGILAFAGLHAQTCFNPNTSTGSDGPYSATSNTTLAGGTYNYTTFNIDPGVTVNVTGNQPLIIYCTGNVTINGSLLANGGNGANGITSNTYGIGGVGVAGGGNGGDGSYSSSVGPLNGTDGNGNGSVTTHGGQWSGGGGAGYSAVGDSSGNPGGGFGGPIYGSANIVTLDAGSGGGGGSGGYSCGSGGGGAGGGLIQISSGTSIVIGATGMISCNGGNGGSDGNGNCGGGGGGSGGSIWLASYSVTNNGSLTANFGTGGSSTVPGNPYYGTGANGAPGRIRVDYGGTLLGTGTTSPAIGFSETPLVTTGPGITMISCNGGSDGSINANAAGGVGPLTYLWTPTNQTTATATGLSAGSYSCVVTDQVGCSITVTVTLTDPTVITTTINPNNPTCFNSLDGNAQVSASGGTGNYTYSWSPQGGTNATAISLPAGTYTCTVTDGNGCTANPTVTLTQPTAVVSNLTTTDPLCFNDCNGTAAVTASGGTPPYTYAWSPSGQTTPTITGLCWGNYPVSVSDANGCNMQVTAVINNPPQIAITMSHTDESAVNANDGTATATVSGGTGAYTYSWAPSGGTNSTANGLGAGTYTCTVTDANGCTMTSTVTILPPNGIVESSVFSSVNIYPNPSNGPVLVNIHLQTQSAIKTEVFNSLGQSVLVRESGETDQLNETLDLSTLPSGIYSIRVSAAENHVSRNIIVQH